MIFLFVHLGCLRPGALIILAVIPIPEGAVLICSDTGRTGTLGTTGVANDTIFGLVIFAVIFPTEGAFFEFFHSVYISLLA
jgi:hypothetical protein